MEIKGFEELEARLAVFDAAVSAGPYPEPGAGEWSAAFVLAHAALVNRFVATSVASVIDGAPVPYSNRLAASEPLLRALVAEAGGLAELKAEVLRTGRVLVRLGAELGPAAGGPIDTYIAEGDIVHVDAPVPAQALIGSVLGYHLPIHQEQLVALAARAGLPDGAPTPTPAMAAA